MVGSTGAGSRNGVRSTNQTPFGYLSGRLAGDGERDRVFPIPPGPTIITRRASAKSRSRSMSSLLRPTSGSAGIGRFVRSRPFSVGNSYSPNW